MEYMGLLMLGATALWFLIFIFYISSIWFKYRKMNRKLNKLNDRTGAIEQWITEIYERWNTDE